MATNSSRVKTILVRAISHTVHNTVRAARGENGQGIKIQARGAANIFHCTGHRKRLVSSSVDTQERKGSLCQRANLIPKGDNISSTWPKTHVNIHDVLKGSFCKRVRPRVSKKYRPKKGKAQSLISSGMWARAEWQKIHSLTTPGGQKGKQRYYQQ